MRWIPRLRMLLARRPWIYWLIIAGLATTVGVATASSIAALDRQRAAWGETVPVLVATRLIAPGDALDGAVTQVAMPRSMVASSALHQASGAMVATQRIAPGEIVVEVDVATAAGPQGLLPSGWLAIRIDDPTASDADAMFELGDAAAVLANGLVVAPDAIIAGLTESGVIVGVPNDVAATVADAAVQRSAVVALSASRP